MDFAQYRNLKRQPGGGVHLNNTVKQPNIMILKKTGLSMLMLPMLTYFYLEQK